MSFYDLTYEGPVVQAILDTAQKLRTEGYIFMGAGTPSTVPGTPTERVWYLCGPGTYANFGASVTVPSGSVMVASYANSAWTKAVIEVSAGGGGGTFATGEAVGDVSLFAELSDLFGKTTAEKELMLPNGNAVVDMAQITGSLSPLGSYTDRMIDSNGASVKPTSHNGNRLVVIFDISSYAGWTVQFSSYQYNYTQRVWAVWQGNTTVSSSGLSLNTDVRVMSDVMGQGTFSGSVVIQSGDKYLAMVNYDGHTASATITKTLKQQVVENTEEISANTSAIATLEDDITHIADMNAVINNANFSTISKTAYKYISYADGTNQGANRWGGTGSDGRANYFATDYIDVSNIAKLQYRLLWSTSTVNAALIAAYDENQQYDATNSIKRVVGKVSEGEWVRSATTKYVRFSIWWNAGLNTFFAFDPSLLGNKIQILGKEVDMLLDGSANDINANNRDRDGFIADMGYSATTLRLLHFSDLHQDPDNMQRIMNWYDKHSDEIDDVLNTGDTVNTQYSGTITGYGSVSGATNSLYVIGNHDIYDGSTYSHSGVDGYNTYIKDYVANWNVIQPSGAEANGYCYYYKDYTTQGIRLVVLDTIVAYYSGSAQQSWFQGVLADAITNNLAVVVACHWINVNRKAVKTHFAPWSDDVTNVSAGSAYVASDVQTFIDNGGEFVCHLIGHTHKDVIGTLYGYPEQLCIMVGSANGLPQDNSLSVTHYGGEVRVLGTRSQDSFNVVGFNVAEHWVGIAKIGVDSNSFGQKKDFLRIDYKTMEEVYTREDKMSIVSVVASSTLSAAVGTYYNVTGAVGTMAVTLPVVQDTAHLSSVILYLTTDTTTALTFTSADGSTIYHSDSYNIEASTTYEINAMYNGTAWVIMAQKIL